MFSALRIAAWLMVAAIPGCSIHGAYAGEQPSPGSSNGDGKAETYWMVQYRRADVLLDVDYERLLVRLSSRLQLALGREQTAWLNDEQIACGPASDLNYLCEARWSFSRAAVLRARRTKLRISRRQWSRHAPLLGTRAEKRSSPALASGALPLSAGAPGPAGVVKTYFVPVTAMPWEWKQGGQNQAFSFGDPNGTAPVVVPLASLGPHPGGSLTIAVAGGKIAIGKGGKPADARGYPGFEVAMGPLGAFPSKYIHGDPVNLGALVGVFTDASGNILGAPFAVGATKSTQTIPRQASQLQLGINDDIFGGKTADTRNTGGFTVQISPGHG